jgi:hypothetical protein
VIADAAAARSPGVIARRAADMRARIAAFVGGLDADTVGASQ